MKKLLSFIIVTLLVFTLAACDGKDTQEIIDDVLDCIDNPEAEGCEDYIPDPTDERTVEEILADTIIENWDGELTHVTVLMDSLDFDDSMEMKTEFSFSVIEDGETEYINAVVTDNMVETVDGLVLHRVIEIDFSGEELYLETILKEVSTGVIVYLNFAPIRLLLVEEGEQEVSDGLDVIGLTEDWFMFKFDDSLANMVELEVVKDMIVSAFFEDFGDSFFYDLQDELDLELGIDPLSDYGLDIGMFIDYLIDGEYDDAETMLDAIDYETLIMDLDAAYLVPELTELLTNQAFDLDAAGFVTATHIIYLGANGTEAWLDSLTEAEIVILVEVLIDAEAEEGDLDLSIVLEQYYAGTLDHYLIMMFLNEPDVETDLSSIPGFDFVAFKATMDTLDYDAFYAEEMDLDLFLNAAYEGQVAYDAFMVNLALTAPQTASILTSLSGIVLEVEQYMYIIDDIDYAFDSLDMFEEFFTLDYYLDNNLLTTEVEKTVEFGILTTVTLEPIAYAYILQDVLGEAVTYLDGFQSFDLPYIEFINCPVDETCEPLPEYQELMGQLALLGGVEYTVLYDPSNPNEVVTKIDFTEFINNLAMLDEEVTTAPVIDLSIQVTVNEAATVTIPTEVSDVNMVAEDFARFSLSMLAYEALGEVFEYYYDNPTEVALSFGDTRQLDTFGDYLNLSLAFDLNMSYVEVSGSILNPEYSIQLYWNDGTLVFTTPLGLAELLVVVGPGTGGPATNAVFEYYVDKVDEDNFNMTKLLFVYIFNDANMNNEAPAPE